jgi:hypothetical protein
VKLKAWLIVILIAVLVGAGGVLLFEKVLLLELRNTDHPRSVQIRIRPLERFTVFYVHTTYNESIIEEFQANHDGIVLKGVRTKSRAILEYFGLEDMKEFHPMNVILGAIFFRVGTGEGQGLVVRDRKIYLSEIGSKGDRIQLRVRSVSLGAYALMALSK